MVFSTDLDWDIHWYWRSFQSIGLVFSLVIFHGFGSGFFIDTGGLCMDLDLDFSMVLEVFAWIWIRAFHRFLVSPIGRFWIFSFRM
jgi:hypothetical protein